MIAHSHRIHARLTLIAAVLAAAGTAAAATAVEEAYWWQDEIRTAAFSLSRQRTGQVARWPRMTVPAGSATLPLPPATGPIVADGKLDEPAWKTATSFPVGPIFGPWRDGPFVLTVRACRDAKSLHLAVESPAPLTSLGSLAPKRELLTAMGRAYRLDEPGPLPGGAAGPQGRIIELSLPLGKAPKALSLSFPVEVVRAPGGNPPEALAALGLTKSVASSKKIQGGASAWLTPIAISLVPSPTRLQLSREVADNGAIRLSHELVDGKGVKQAATSVVSGGPDGVYPYAWQAKAGSQTFLAEGFFYVEPLPDGACASQETRQRHRRAYCAAREARAQAHRSLLDAPLLFVRREPYYAAHIYDDYYTWHPGGGIYVLENPSDPPSEHKVRALIDPTTEPTLGGGVYRDPDISWDGRRVLFAHKADKEAWTSIHEIGADGRNLRRLTGPKGYHDITPCYLPDGRIAFTSTRPKGRVPCFNSGVDTLHTMAPDGGEIRSISSNNVTEFDPSVLPDGRIIYGRWEYVDKTALYMQSLWTVFPDGTHETALFANNLAKPTALLDARAVPGSAAVVASLTPHNGQAVGAVGLIEHELGKNDLAAVTNFTPEYPVEMDQGLRTGPSNPWPLSADDVLINNNARGGHSILELISRDGGRELIYCDPNASCYSPMLAKPRPRPPVIGATDPGSDATGRFLVVDAYRGLTGVERGEIERLRIVEETARVSEVPPGGRWWNQAFLISWQGAYTVKNVLGVVPVHADGSAYFEAPAGRALYVEALDADGREIQRMRTYVQAVPGAMRSCVGCHESKHTAPPRRDRMPLALSGPPARPAPESWGSGYVDYATMVQPILDRHCVRCHGGPEGISGGIDLSGGWTRAFNLSYETLLKNNLVGFMRCHNSDVTSTVVLKPRTIGSGAAPLAELLLSGHKDRIKELTRRERELIFAWMDTNSNYYGTWDYTPFALCEAYASAATALAGQMKAAGCTKCHAAGHVGNDWINLTRPAMSRILRAPQAKAKGSPGLAWCRPRKAQQGLAVVKNDLPPDVFHPPSWPKRDPDGQPVISFASTEDPHYRKMLATIEDARRRALTRPRVDMPGARIVSGQCRLQAPMPLPESIGPLSATLIDGECVRLQWPQTAETIGLEFELHRAATADFAPNERTRIARVTGFRFLDVAAPSGVQHYALVPCSGDERGEPVRAAVTMPPASTPAAPTGLTATAGPLQVALQWLPVAQMPGRYHVYRARAGSTEYRQITGEPIAEATYCDTDVAVGVEHVYTVRAVSRRGILSEATTPASAAAKAVRREPIFSLNLSRDVAAAVSSGGPVKGKLHGGAKVAGGVLDLRQGGHVTFAHRGEFDAGPQFSLSLWVYLDKPTQMPVAVSCGRWQGSGWFLQQFGGGWRWYVGGAGCDGGKSTPGRWTHLAATFDGRVARLYQDGKQVGSQTCRPANATWPGPLFVGQYGPSPGPQYQVAGRIADVKLYRRALSAGEAAEQSEAGAPGGR